MPKEPVLVKPGIELFSFARKKDELRLGDHFGNYFTITIKNCQVANLPRSNINLVPNYFGHQRFGISRPISHLVGLNILKGDFQEAVMIYLTDPGLKDDESYLEAKNEFYEALAHEQEMKQQALTSSEIIGTIDLKDKKKGDEE